MSLSPPDGDEALFLGEERGRDGQEDGREDSGKKITPSAAGVKGKSTNSGPSFSLSSRLRLFRIGGYRCNQVRVLRCFLCAIPSILQKRDKSIGICANMRVCVRVRATLRT